MHSRTAENLAQSDTVVSKNMEHLYSSSDFLCHLIHPEQLLGRTAEELAQSVIVVLVDMKHFCSSSDFI